MHGELVLLEENLKHKLEIYYGLSFDELASRVGLNASLIKGKASTVNIVNKLINEIGISTKRFQQEKGIILSIKSVKLKENGVPKESMSFEQINFHEVVQEDWEYSFIRKKFLNTAFCFFVFQEINKEVYFKGIKIWKMPEELIEDKVHSFWKKLRVVLEVGVVIEKRKYGSVNNLPSSTENSVMHVRPKARDSNDKVELPCGQLITKQAYWLNAAFIAKILKNMPDLNLKKISKINNVKIDWNGRLKADIYTVEKILEIGRSIKNGFNVLDIDEQSLLASGYHIDSNFIIKEEFESVEDYLKRKILQQNYFDCKAEDIFDTPYVKRKIENLENAYKLLKVEKNIYLTERGMENAQVSKEEITSYKNKVEQFVKKEDFFTLESLKSSGFKHEIVEYGFDEIFYENLLKRPGRLQNLTFGSKLFFIKTVNKVDPSDFIKNLLNCSHISIDQIISEIEANFKVRLTYDAVENSLKNLDDYYYASNLRRIFKSKDDYFDYLGKN